MPTANNLICACGHWYHLHEVGKCRTCDCTRIPQGHGKVSFDLDAFERRLERQQVIEFSDVKMLIDVLREYVKRNDRAEGILRGLVDAIAGEQEEPGELARALGREAPHWIERARALLRERDHGKDIPA